MKTKKVCVVTSHDPDGYRLDQIVEAHSPYEAAAIATELWRQAGKVPSDIEVIVQEPGVCWTITLPKLAKWVSSSVPGDSIGLQATKRSVRQFLAERLSH